MRSSIVIVLFFVSAVIMFVSVNGQHTRITVDETSTSKIVCFIGNAISDIQPPFVNYELRNQVFKHITAFETYTAREKATFSVDNYACAIVKLQSPPMTTYFPELMGNVKSSQPRARNLRRGPEHVVFPIDQHDSSSTKVPSA
jgi:hypothetical protein